MEHSKHSCIATGLVFSTLTPCTGGEQGKDGAVPTLSRAISMPVDISCKKLYQVSAIIAAVLRTFHAEVLLSVRKTLTQRFKILSHSLQVCRKTWGQIWGPKEEDYFLERRREMSILLLVGSVFLMRWNCTNILEFKLRGSFLTFLLHIITVCVTRATGEEGYCRWSPFRDLSVPRGGVGNRQNPHASIYSVFLRSVWRGKERHPQTHGNRGLFPFPSSYYFYWYMRKMPFFLFSRDHWDAKTLRLLKSTSDFSAATFWSLLCWGIWNAASKENPVLLIVPASSVHWDQWQSTSDCICFTRISTR